MRSTHTLQADYLKVSDQQEIYFETYGNQNGIPVLFLHGGPGLGISDLDKIFFDPSHFYVTFFDQRGAGKSIKNHHLAINHTAALIDDMIQLLDHLNIQQVYLFGGSWGSSLAFLFTIKYPQRVRGLILRGLFPASNKSRQHFENGGNALFFPKAWRRYESLVPKAERKDIGHYYAKMILSDDKVVSKKFASESIRYALAVLKKDITTVDIDSLIENIDYWSKAKIQAHYSLNHFFIPDNFIFENLDAIGNLPVWIVHGRYDMICPVVSAVDFHQKLKNSQLFILNAGHASHDPAIEKKLKEILNEIANHKLK